MMDRVKLAFLTSGGAGTLFVQMNFIFCFWKAVKNENVDIILYGHGSQELNELIVSRCDFISEYYSYAKRSECFKYDAAVELVLYPAVIFINPKIEQVAPMLYQRLVSWQHFVEGDPNRKYAIEHPFIDYFTYQYAEIHNKNCLSIFDIDDNLNVSNTFQWKLIIKDDTEFINSLGLTSNEYITIQRGATPGMNLKDSPKLWPIEYYEELIRLLHQVFPNKKIVQLGEGNNTSELKGIDISLIDKTTWSSLGEVLKHSWIHIDGECGMVHFRRALNAGPSVVIFGATSAKFYGYKENINIASDVCCDGCARLTNYWQEKCVLRDEIKCLKAITPQMVISRIVAWDILKSIKSGKECVLKYSKNNELLKDNDYYIDSTYNHQYLSNMNIFYYEKQKRRLSDLKALIMKKGRFEYVSLRDTPGYSFLCGDVDKYEKHIGELRENYGDKTHSLHRYKKLLSQIQKNGFNKNSNIIVDDKNQILDGNHRGAWLLFTYGKDYEVEVIRIYTLHEDMKWDLFPFEKVRRNSNVLIYGANGVGQSYVEQLLYTEYASVKGLIDMFPEVWNVRSKYNLKCWSSEKMTQELFKDVDYVVLATRNDQHAREMGACLKEFIDKSCIIGRCSW